jgi:hypothetical protein
LRRNPILALDNAQPFARRILTATSNFQEERSTTVSSVLVSPPAAQLAKTVSKPLAEALEKLEIPPMNPDAVKLHKRHKLETAWKTLRSLMEAEGWTDLFHMEDQIYMSVVRHDLGPVWTDDDLYLCMRRGNWPTFPRCIAMGWHKHGIAFAHPPFHIQRKMAQISSEVPGVTFAADVLESDSTTYDPFLIARYQGEEYYIEVWGDDDREFPR